ncbi:RNA polymerase sigma-70 factor, ECF subfamily [Modestobacter sp. DSM 44400]|uniref:sigma-70 family RNA polymerase sigma factor n=1 Tax=Modestobacter sp. DSM 44400 TaxID=1550230 RepID=UPI000897BCD0|nr:sigma-70 family RNA polymerase sigma factor [Modestobacter sp. DSM 44400]SDY91034.1 RNA polymerase sigma-70 factor, ECF subfamily [Modestobacter sp. DSM 44400]
MPERDDDGRQLMTDLCQDHAEVVFSFVLRYVDGDRQRAEDVVQETLLRVWRHRDGLDDRRGNVRPYLLTTARNVLTDQWRAAQRRPRLVSDETTLAAAPSGEDIDAAVEGWLVAEALQRLTPAHRDVVRALHYEGRSVADTARLLGVPEGTVKSRSYYAVRALRAAFEEMGVIR